MWFHSIKGKYFVFKIVSVRSVIASWFVVLQLVKKKKSMTSKTDQNKKKLTTAQWSMSFMEIIGFVTHFHTLYWYSICFPSNSIGNLTHNPLPCYTFWMRDHSRFSIDVVAFAIKYLMFNQIQKPSNDSIT